MVGVGGTNMAGAGAPIGPGASGWWVKEADITNGEGRVAFPRVTSRPLDRRMIFLPSRNSISSTCG
jgi:hypothetical protein